MEEMGRVCQYLDEVVLHERIVAERSFPRDANAIGHRSAPPVEVDPILELFRSEDEHHILSVFVVKQIVEV
jgi:hypothetical protein